MSIVDLRGKPCPIPVIEVKKLLAAAAPGANVSVLVDNDVARQNLMKLAEGEGHAFRHEQTPEGIAVVFTVRENRPHGAADEKGGLAVAIGADHMGRGSEALGKALIKSFIFSLTELDDPPEHILFFNGGVHLTCEGSAALNDLAVLEGKGAFINSCGACLNYYNKTEQLKIGGVTNMFAILETMARAKRLVTI